MNIKQIEAFCHLSETLNFSKAAEKMYIAQPVFSRMIASLEEELGCKLFVRSKTEPQLSFAGESIINHMKRIYREYEDLKNIIGAINTNTSGLLRVGLLDSGLLRKHRDLIADFMNNYPHCVLDLKEYSEVELLRAIELGWADVGFVSHYPGIFKESMNNLIIDQHRECLVVNKIHRFSGKDQISINDFKKEPMVFVRETKSELGYNRIMTMCLQFGFSPNFVMKTDSILGTLDCVACGVGCTILPDALEYMAGQDLVFIPIAESEPIYSRMVWAKKNNSHILQQFLNYTRNQLNIE